MFDPSVPNPPPEPQPPVGYNADSVAPTPPSTHLDSDITDELADHLSLAARDLQLATPQWMAGKTFDGAAPCGPALVTADEVAHDGIEFSLTLNGEEMQASGTSDLIFAVPELVAHLSTLMSLEPGDLIATGTPAGVGIARKPSVWLKPGDVIEISSPQLGLLRTRVS